MSTFPRGTCSRSVFPSPCGNRPDRPGRISKCILKIWAVLWTINCCRRCRATSSICLPPHLVTQSLTQGLVLIEAGNEVDYVYFPHYGMLSLLVVLKDGKAIETATVGCEGVVGAMAGLGLYKSLVRVVVQLPVGVTKISATQFRKEAAASDAIRNLCVQYDEVLLSQARVTDAMHVIEERFCLWMLQSADRAGSSTVNLTQEFLAEMLGVRRTSVTEVASRIQTAGVINYSRGMIKILDRPALERMSCECY